MKKLQKVILFTLMCAIISIQSTSFAEIAREDYKTDYDYYKALAQETVKVDDYLSIEEYNIALESKTEELMANDEKNTEAKPDEKEEEIPAVDDKPETELQSESLYPKTVLEDAEEQKEKYKALRELGIMDFGEDFDASMPVTRGEFAAVIANIYNGGVIIEETNPRFMFSDINETSPVYNEICSLINGGIILGYDDGTFAEDRNIVYEEALIIVTNLLGFDNYESLGADKYSVYMSLIDGIDIAEYFRNQKTEVTRGAMANIIYELLFTNTMYKAFTTDMRMGYSFSTETVLYKYYSYMYTDGVVSANEFTSLSSVAGAAQKNGIAVNGIQILFAEKEEIYKYLGYYVTAIYDENGSGKAIKLNLKKNNELLIEAKDIESFDEQTYRLNYYNENEKLKNIDIKNDITLIFNDAVIEDLFDNTIFTPSNGKLVFIDNDRDGTYEILKIDAYVTYIVESVTANGSLLNDAMGLHERIDLANGTYKMTKNGEIIDYSNISKNSVVMVAAPFVEYKTVQGIKYMTPDIDRCEFYKIVAVDNKIFGKKNGGTNSKIIFEGNEYDISKELAIAVSMETVTIPNNGVAFEIGLDLNGDVAFVNTSSIVSSGVTYAFLKKLVWDEENEAVYFKAFDVNGTHISVILPEKVYVYRMWTKGSITTKNYYRQRIESQELIDRITVPELFDEGEFVPQLIKYSANANGEIDTIYIAVDTFDGTVASMIKKPVANSEIFTREFRTTEVEGGYQGNGHMTYYWFRADHDMTTFMTIPGDLSNDSLYRVNTKYDSVSSYFSVANENNWDMAGYDADSDCDLPILVMREPSNVQVSLTGTEITDVDFAFSAGVVIDNINEVYNDKTDEIKYQLEGYQGKNKVSYYFDNSDLVSNTVTDRADISNIPITGLKRGDIIWIAKNSAGNISGFRVLWHDVTNKSAPGYMGSFYEKPLGPTEQTGTSYRLSHSGVVTGVGDWSVYIKAYDNGYLRKALCDVGTNVYLLTSKGNRQKIEVIDFSDIQPGDYVKTKQTYVRTQEILVIRD